MLMIEIIKEKLEKALHPEHIEIINDSARHHGHAGDNGTGESHFKLIVVSNNFENLDRIDRQKLVYAALAQELSGPIHALSIKAHTPKEYFKITN